MASSYLHLFDTTEEVDATRQDGAWPIQLQVYTSTRLAPWKRWLREEKVLLNIKNDMGEGCTTQHAPVQVVTGYTRAEHMIQASLVLRTQSPKRVFLTCLTRSSINLLLRTQVIRGIFWLPLMGWMMVDTDRGPPPVVELAAAHCPLGCEASMPCSEEAALFCPQWSPETEGVMQPFLPTLGPPRRHGLCSHFDFLRIFRQRL